MTTTTAPGDPPRHSPHLDSNHVVRAIARPVNANRTVLGAASVPLVGLPHEFVPRGGQSLGSATQNICGKEEECVSQKHFGVNTTWASEGDWLNLAAARQRRQKL